MKLPPFRWAALALRCPIRAAYDALEPGRVAANVGDDSENAQALGAIAPLIGARHLPLAVAPDLFFEGLLLDRRTARFLRVSQAA